MILFHKRFVTIAEVRFGPDPAKGHAPASYPGVDILCLLQTPQSVPGTRGEPAHTLLNDLSQEPEVLLKAMDKTTRYEITRAQEKDHLTYRSWRQPDSAVIREFRDFFSRFAGSKGIPEVSESYLQALAGAGQLDLSSVLSEQAAPLTWHAHLIEKGRSRLLHSASVRMEKKAESDDNTLRNLVGRANRYHHWEDMLRFRAEGCRLYDFGGWYDGQEDPERLRINQFKERFGGTPEKSFNIKVPLTWRGKAYLKLKAAIGRA